MARPYSADLRERAVAAVVGGLSCHRAAAVFQVGVSSVIRWHRLWRETGSVKAKAMGGKVKPKLAGQREWLLDMIESDPSLTVEELRVALAGRGLVAGYGAVWRFLDREKLTFKKTQHAAEQDRPDVAEARAQWRATQDQFDPSCLVFIDETWAKTNMARECGRSPRGRRLPGKVPFGKWTTTTFVAALRLDGIAAPMVLDGPINGTWFRTYGDEVLVPS